MRDRKSMGIALRIQFYSSAVSERLKLLDKTSSRRSKNCNRSYCPRQMVQHGSIYTQFTISSSTRPSSITLCGTFSSPYLCVWHAARQKTWSIAQVRSRGKSTCSVRARTSSTVALISSTCWTWWKKFVLCARCSSIGTNFYSSSFNGTMCWFLM